MSSSSPSRASSNSSPLEPPPSDDLPQTPPRNGNPAGPSASRRQSAREFASSMGALPSFQSRRDLEPPPSLGRRRQSAPADVLQITSGLIRLRVAGLGHYFELDAAPDVTLGDLEDIIEKKTELPAPYQRLVAKRKKMDDDTMVLGPSIMEGNTIVSMGIGLEDRTKILLLHSPLFATDKEGIDKLNVLIEEIDRIDKGRRSRDMDNKTVQELIIQVCCKIDCVETNGSEALRKMRKLTIRKAEAVAKKSEEDIRGVDP